VSLRARLALTFAAVVAISLLVAAVSLFALLQGYSNRLVQARLDDVAVVAGLQARAMLNRGQTASQVLDYLEDQATSLDVRILLVDPRGTVLRDVGEGPSLVGLTIPLDVSSLRRAQPGSESVPNRRLGHGSFRSPRDGQSYLYSALPAALAPVRLGEPGFLLVAQAEGPLLASLGPLLGRLGLAAGAGLAAGLVAAMALARWLGQPLGRLAGATRAVARGDYSARVEPSGPPELARLAASFNTMAAEVERSRALVGRFVSTLSHELRTPLTSIRGFAQAVLDGRANEPGQLQRAMQIVDHEARRMQRLSADLLDLSRLQAGQVPMEHRAVDLASLAAQSAEVLAGRAEQQGVEIALEATRPLPVEGDADRLGQVLTNLLDNAIKFTPRDQRIVVRGALVGLPARTAAPNLRELRLFGRAKTPPPGPERAAVVEVINPGPGISAEDVDRLFEQFYTAAEGQQRGGVGLGLPIAREIARAHGGDLTLESAGGLTTARLTLPAALSTPRGRNDLGPSDPGRDDPGRNGVVTANPLTAERQS
jgi:signal transduction histidine kinase